MNRKVKKIRLLIFLIAGGIIAIASTQRKNDVDIKSYLQLDNIEALALSEDGGILRCFGSGSIDCEGYKVKHTISGYRLPIK